MAVANLVDEGTTYSTGNDNIVIVDVFASIRGGRTLDVTGFTPTVIKAGHLIIQETATGEFKPMPVSGSAYAALPAGHTYAGVLINTILKSKPFAGILTQGTVNHVAGPYTITTILAAVKAALNLIDFRADN
jgi:hypothetical protein